jgi:hypothetical protein
MKKFFSNIGIILLVAAVIAVFTSPGKEKCLAYIKEKSAEPITCTPTIMENPFKIFGGKIFSFFTVYYCTHPAASANGPLRRLVKDSVTGKYSVESDTFKRPGLLQRLGIAPVTKTEKYIGAFGTFWKY